MSLPLVDRTCRSMVLCGTIALLAFGTDSKKGVRISGPMTALGFQGDVTGAKFSPDGARVVYHGDADDDNVFELYSVPVDGSTLEHPCSVRTRRASSSWATSRPTASASSTRRRSTGARRR
jgi:Tol biopolymer transport system component